MAWFACRVLLGWTANTVVGAGHLLRNQAAEVGGVTGTATTCCVLRWHWRRDSVVIRVSNEASAIARRYQCLLLLTCLLALAWFDRWLFTHSCRLMSRCCLLQLLRHWVWDVLIWLLSLILKALWGWLRRRCIVHTVLRKVSHWL